MKSKQLLNYLFLVIILSSCSSQKIIRGEGEYEQTYLIELKVDIRPSYIKNKFPKYKYLDHKDHDKSINQYSFNYLVDSKSEERLFIEIRADEQVVSVNVPGKEFADPKSLIRNGKKIQSSKRE